MNYNKKTGHRIHPSTLEVEEFCGGLIKGLGVALLGVTGIVLSTNSVSANEIATQVGVKTGIQDTPISRADIATLSEDQKARIVEGQITDVPMSWINAETGNVEWITDYVLVYQKSGKCVKVPAEDVSAPPATVADVVSNVTGVDKATVTKVLPNTGEVSANYLYVAGIGLASVAGYLMFRNSRTGKKMAIALLAAGSVGVSSQVLADSADFLSIVDTVKIELSSKFSHTAPEDPNGCWEYIGYIPEIASVPRNEVPSVELPSLDIDIPNEAPTHEVPELKLTRWITEDGEELVGLEEGSQEPREFEGYTFEGTEVDGSITTHIYHKVVTDIPNEAPTHELPTADIEELPDVETKGSVVVRFVNTEGVEIANQEVDTPETVVSTTKRKQVTINGVATVIPETTNVDVVYDTTDLIKDKIISEDGTEWFFKQVKEGDIEQSNVVEGVTTITYIYEKATTDIPNEAPTHELLEGTIEELDPVEEGGSVTAHFVDTNGNVIKDPTPVVTNVIVNTIERTKITVNGESSVKTTTTPSGESYDATTVRPQTINFDGKVYEYVEVHADSASENGTVPVGQTDVTFVYRHVPQIATREETSQVTGDVVVKYVDTNGVEIKNPFTLVDDGVVSNTTTTITTTDGVETGREDNTVPTGLTYDSTTQKPASIDFNGNTYNFKQLKDGDNETGNVVEGTTTVTYIYEQVPKTTTETSTREVYGNVVTRYINEVTGQEIVSGSNIVTGGLVATETTTTVKDAQGGIVSQDTVRTPSGLTYDTTADKAQKDAQIATMRTTPTHYTNTATGELLSVDVPVELKQSIIARIDTDTGVDNHGDSVLLSIADELVESKGFSSITSDVQILPSESDYIRVYKYTNTTQSSVLTQLSGSVVPYEFTRVDVSETGSVEEGTKIITYYYRPSALTWTPTEVEEGVVYDSYGTLARD